MTNNVDYLFMDLHLLGRNSYLSPLAIFLVGLSFCFWALCIILSMKLLSPMIFKYCLPFCRWSFCFLDLSPSTHKSFYFVLFCLCFCCGIWRHCQIPGQEMLLSTCADQWLPVMPGMGGWRGPRGQLSPGDSASRLCFWKTSVKEQVSGLMAGRRHSLLARRQSGLGGRACGFHCRDWNPMQLQPLWALRPGAKHWTHGAWLLQYVVRGSHDFLSILRALFRGWMSSVCL